jgi:hypothetical protein
VAGLLVSTTITLLLVPVVYAIFVMDLKWVRWEQPPETPHLREEEYYGELVSSGSLMKS